MILQINDCLVQHPSLASLIYCGDLNFPNLKWPSANIEGGTHSDRLQAQLMLDFFQRSFPGTDH